MRLRPTPLIAILLSALSVLSCATATPDPGPPGLADLTLEEKVGQMFVVGAHADFMNVGSAQWRALEHAVTDRKVGGVIWFASDVLEAGWLNSELQSLSRVPLIISADLEAGPGMRFPDATYWPWAMAMGATGDPELARQAGVAVARNAKTIGINQIYAPVADVNNNPDNPVINVRSFGEDPETVGRFVSAFIEGVQSEGVIATVKHFPGHGDTQTDSHRSLPVLGVTRARLDRVELPPFRAALDAGVRSVMIAHLAIPELDARPIPVRPDLGAGENPYGGFVEEVTERGTMPASLSQPIIEGLLRDELGFEGLIVSDALDMGGIVQHFTPAESAVRAIEAGIDQIVKPVDLDLAIDGVLEAVRTGRIAESRIDESVERILESKRGLELPAFDPRSIMREFDSLDDRRIAAEIARRAITLLREEDGALPLRRGPRTVELVISDFQEPGEPLAGFGRRLRSEIGTAVRIPLDRRSTPVEIADAEAAASSAERVILSIAVRTRSGSGRVAIPEGVLAMLERLAGLPTPPSMIAVGFGNPYLVRELPFVKTWLLTYGPQPVMQAAAADAVFGIAPVSGKLPVTIPGVYARGSGIVKP
jgi:beta-N-acetylhexosaminidase